jgi:hypothetical protein
VTAVAGLLAGGVAAAGAPVARLDEVIGAANGTVFPGAVSGSVSTTATTLA